MARRIIIRLIGVMSFLGGYYYIVDLLSAKALRENASRNNIQGYLGILSIVIGFLLIALVDREMRETFRIIIAVLRGKTKIEGTGIKIRTVGIAIVILGVSLFLVWFIPELKEWKFAAKLHICSYIGVGSILIGIPLVIIGKIVMYKESVKRIREERERIIKKYNL